MQMEFKRELPIPKVFKELYPIDSNIEQIKNSRDEQIKNILSGNDNRLLLIIGPCSADNEVSVLDYISRLVKVQEKVKDKLFIIPRIYTNKPRTTGEGYKGLAHQPDPNSAPDMLSGLIAMRKLHIKTVRETGFTCAEEMLYPDNHRYLSDLLSYVAVGARSVENQQHRLAASGLGIPVGMKNPTSGDLTVMLNSITAAQSSHTFIYRGWEVETTGNPYAHAILRGWVNKHSQTNPNYHYEDLISLYEKYCNGGYQNPAVIIDTNHSNSNKNYLEQIRISKDVLYSYTHSSEIKQMVKGLMIESYIEDGCQKIGEGIYGKSITDPCLGWEKTERLIYDIADIL